MTRSRTFDDGELKFPSLNARPSDTPSPGEDARVDWGLDAGSEELQMLIYLDPRALTRDCVGRWLQSSLSGFSVCLLPDPEQITAAPIVSGDIRAVVINVGRERMSSPTVARLLSRVSELLPTVPVALMSDYEDPESIQEAFELGVRGYIPTSLASTVAVAALQLVCCGGTFAPAAALLSQRDRPHGSGSRQVLEGFTLRQSDILDCLRRGMANKMIAYQLSMCESTVKVHVRNIMKKLKATNRTQVAYMTHDLFAGVT
ncbi:MAG TPA: response regulator transcription factor [Propionibacteriaceae bacterium]|nr:response regulator transcription factor [Propionibacteriaceae bacterium]